jgi:hypothetical protein
MNMKKLSDRPIDDVAYSIPDLIARRMLMRCSKTGGDQGVFQLDLRSRQPRTSAGHHHRGALPRMGNTGGTIPVAAGLRPQLPRVHT